MTSLLQQVRDSESAVTAWLDLPTHTAGQREIADSLDDKLQDLDTALMCGADPTRTDAILNALAGVNTMAKNDPAFASIVTVINRLTEK